MLRKLLFGFAGLAWFGVVFLFGLWLTFPSDTVVERVRYEFDALTDGSMALDMSSLAPRPLLGLSMTDISLSSVEEEDEQRLLNPVMKADYGTASVGFFSLLSFTPAGSGYLVVGDTNIDYSLVASSEGLQELEVQSDSVSIATIGALLEPFVGDTLTGSGSLKVDVDLDLSEGVAKASGKVRLRGNDDVTLTIKYWDQFAMDYDTMGPISVSDFDIELEITDGKAKVDRGKLESDYLTVALTGDITLKKSLGRSSIRLRAVLSDLGPDLSAVGGAMSRAKWKDDTYHYRISCSFERLGARCLKPERERRARKPRAPRERSSVSSDREERRKDRRRKLRDRARPDRTDRGMPRLPRRPGDVDFDDEDDDGDDDEFDDEEEGFDDEPGRDDLEDMPIPPPGMEPPPFEAIPPPAPGLGIE